MECSASRGESCVAPSSLYHLVPVCSTGQCPLERSTAAVQPRGDPGRFSGIPGAHPRFMRISLAVFFLAAACGNDHAMDPPPPGDEPVYYGQVQNILDDN